ncbi:hypothetical protein R1sor_026605 [Riccia sorocarpa]|uniref:Uncharacterized protein n=1 Tax=Riccia sorocarpa TaxID=122646 RepID=A0ABD3GEQ4_9MARC
MSSHATANTESEPDAWQHLPDLLIEQLSKLEVAIPCIFQSIGPVLRLPVIIKELVSHEVRALILWDPTVPPLQTVTMDLKWPGGRIRRLGFHVSFEALGAEEKLGQQTEGNASSLPTQWNAKPTLF